MTLNIFSSDVSSFLKLGQACVLQEYGNAVSLFITCSTYQNLFLSLSLSIYIYRERERNVYICIQCTCLKIFIVAILVLSKNWKTLEYEQYNNTELYSKALIIIKLKGYSDVFSAMTWISKTYSWAMEAKNTCTHSNLFPCLYFCKQQNLTLWICV